MKRKTIFVLIAVLLLSMLSFAGCRKSEFGNIDNTGKSITVNAKNAAKDAFFMVGTLEVAEGEKISISSHLEKGSVKIEIVSTAGNDDIDQLPKLDGEAIITANVRGSDISSGTVEAGSYMLRATCLEKATGTVVVEVLPAG